MNFTGCLKNWDKRFETYDLDEFRTIVAVALERQQKALASEDASLLKVSYDADVDLESYRSHLEDRWSVTQEMIDLSGELAIVALYKKVELHTKRVALKVFPKVAPQKLSSIDGQIKSLPFNLEDLAEFQAFSEIRLINNSVKHSGKVSAPLAKEFPAWVEGDPLKGLDAAYERLKPLVSIYVEAFVSACYLQK
jgi:hypothetical protein